MPLASTRNVTSRRATPAGRGSIGIVKRARLRLSAASSRSPWSTWMSTDVWPSTAVVKVSLALAGIVVLRSIRRLKTPPMVSMPSESGTTSRSSMSRRAPTRSPAWMPAPSATTSSGSMSTSGGRPKMASMWRRTSGMRVLPPTATTCPTSEGASPASRSACRQGPVVRSTRSRTRASSSSRVSTRRTSAVGQAEHQLGALAGAQRALGLLGEREDLGAHLRMLAERGRQLGQQQLRDPGVEVVAAEPRVPGGGEHLEDARPQLEDRDVEGAAAEVVDDDHPLRAAIEAVGERRRGGLVDEPQDLEPREPTGVAGRLALAVVEVRGHGDDGLLHRAAERRLGPALELAQHVGG